MPPVSYFRPLRRLGEITALYWLLIGFCLTGVARDAGGGEPSEGAKVTLTLAADTATLSNGILRVVIEKTTGKVRSFLFDGTQMVDTGNPIYYSTGGGKDFEVPWGCEFSVISQTEEMIEVSCKRRWRADAGYKYAVDMDLRYILRRGDTGLYAYNILDHPASYPQAWLGEWRIVWKLPRTDSKYIFTHAYVDALRNWEMPSLTDYQKSTPTGIPEICRLTTGKFAGQYDGKYSYAARYAEIGTWGMTSESLRKGVWFVLGGHDYFNDGPTKQDLTLANDYILLHFGRNHYDGGTMKIQAGERWRKMFGPFLLYCNRTAKFTDPGDALWADAREQVAAEQAAWPYAWLVNDDHPTAAGRGTVTGRLVIADALKPGLNAAGAHIGLAAPEAVAGNWQSQAKGYQYWTRAEADGSFSLPGVRPGTYTLYVFTDGVVGEYSKTSVTVAAGETNAQGTLTWNVPHPGASIAWEIGVPDRTASEFRHGTDYFKPYLWDNFGTEFENPLVYTIGVSTPAKDWNYVQCALPTTPGGSTFVDWKWLVDFDLTSVPTSGNATLTLAFASSHYSRLWVQMNGSPRPGTRIRPSDDGGNALLRQGIHAKYSWQNVPIPVSSLKVGRNTLVLHFSGTDQASHVMYDYLRLELPAAPADRRSPSP